MIIKYKDFLDSIIVDDDLDFECTKIAIMGVESVVVYYGGWIVLEYNNIDVVRLEKPFNEDDYMYIVFKISKLLNVPVRNIKCLLKHYTFFNNE